MQVHQIHLLSSIVQKCLSMALLLLLVHQKSLFVLEAVLVY
jgi:hypothetical protein